MPQAIPALIMAGAQLWRGYQATGKLDFLDNPLFAVLAPELYGTYQVTGFSYKVDEALGLAPGKVSQNFAGATPQVTVSRGTPVPMAFGRVRIAGNIIRQNDFIEDDYIKCIVCYGYGGWEDIEEHYINDIDSSELVSNITIWEHLGTYSQAITNLWNDNETCNFRYLVCVEYQIKKSDKLINDLQNIYVIAKTRKLLDIGASTYSFTRNPAQIGWSWQLWYKGHVAAELDENAFLSLYVYCSASMSSTDTSKSPVTSYSRIAAGCAATSWRKMHPGATYYVFDFSRMAYNLTIQTYPVTGAVGMMSPAWESEEG